MHPRHRDPQYTRVPFRLPVSGSGSDFYARILHVGQASGEENQRMILQNLKSQWSENVGDERAEKYLGREMREESVMSSHPPNRKSRRIICQGKNSLSPFISQFPGFLIFSRIMLKSHYIFYLTEVYHL